MKLSGFFVLFALALLVSAKLDKQETEPKYDLKDADQFSFFFKEKWETMFNTPAPLAMRAKAEIVNVLADPMKYASCYSMSRDATGKEFFEQRLWGMHHAIIKCSVDSSTVLPPVLSSNKPADLLRMEFVQNMSYVSYTNKFHEMSMHLKAKKSDLNDSWKIYEIVESCTLN